MLSGLVLCASKQSLVQSRGVFMTLGSIYDGVFLQKYFKVLYSDKLSGDGRISQVSSYLNSYIDIKLP